MRVPTWEPLGLIEGIYRQERFNTISSSEQGGIMRHMTDLAGGVVSLTMVVLLLVTTTIADGEGDSKYYAASLDSIDLQVVDQVNRVGFETLLAMAEVKSETDNILLSPVAMYATLVLTLNGASGETYEKLQESLGLEGLEIDEINRRMGNILNNIQRKDSALTMHIVNSLWHRDDIVVTDEFSERCKNQLACTIHEFDNENPDYVRKINGWISDNTDGYIDHVLAGPVTAKDAVFLINATFFKGA